MHAFWELVRDPNHWGFELLVTLLVDGIFGALIWPRIRRWRAHHKQDDKQLADLLRRIERIEEYYELPGSS